MTLDQVMDPEYRKLIAARDMVRDAVAELLEEDNLLVFVSSILLLALMLPDSDSVEAEPLTRRGVLDLLYNSVMESDDPAVEVPLYPEDIEWIMAVAGKYQLPADINREVALRFADAANEMIEGLDVDRAHLARSLGT